MEVEDIKIFLSRASVRIAIFVKGDDGEYVNVTSATVTVTDPSGTEKVTDGAMTNQDTGKYDYVYHKGATAEAMAEGVWTVDGDVWDGSGENAINTPFHTSFVVKG